MAEYEIGPVGQIPKGEGRNFQVAGRRIAVFRTVGGAVFATQAECPHMNGPLADGLTDEETVVCPLHDRIYNLRTGAGTDCGIAVFPVRLDVSDRIVLDM